MKNKMKQWRREAEQHNRDESISRGEKTTHQGRKYKSKIGTQWMNAVSPLFMALMDRGGMRSKQSAS